MIGLYGPHNVIGCTENKNYSAMLKQCDENNFSDCIRLQQYKSDNNGRFLPPSKEVKKVKMLECLNDFEIIMHLACCVIMFNKDFNKRTGSVGFQQQKRLIRGIR